MTTCEWHSSVEGTSNSLEQWEPEPEALDAVLTASSMHWIPSESSDIKAISALNETILLVKKELRPRKSKQVAL